MSRPEYTAPPEVFYNDEESEKYTENTRIQRIQAEMTLRALELLNLDPGQFILDIGCGSGLSGEILSEEGHYWVGMDISPSMLGVALDRGCEGDLFWADMGDGVPFRAGTFDAVISISAIQWLCNADTSHANPKQRLKRFFETLYAALKRGGKAVCQYYPTDENQSKAILEAAKLTGFGGGLVIDNAEAKRNRKYYLVLVAGEGEEGLNLSGVKIDAAVKNAKKSRKNETRTDYIMRKKETARKRGKDVALDSKFTGRRRKARF